MAVSKQINKCWVQQQENLNSNGKGNEIKPLQTSELPRPNNSLDSERITYSTELLTLTASNSCSSFFIQNPIQTQIRLQSYGLRLWSVN